MGNSSQGSFEVPGPSSDPHTPVMVRKRVLVPKRGEKGSSVLKRNVQEYCKSTSIHGFAYWVQAQNSAEKLVWIVSTVLSITCAGLIISAAFWDWQENPGVTRIESFSQVGR